MITIKELYKQFKKEREEAYLIVNKQIIEKRNAIDRAYRRLKEK